MSLSRGFVVVVLAAWMALGVAGCDTKGPAEQTGEKVDRALGTDRGDAARQEAPDLGGAREDRR